MTQASVSDFITKNQILKIRNFFSYSFIALPALYMGFWVIDVLYAPQFKWYCLGIRAVAVICFYAIYLISSKRESLSELMALSLMYCLVASLGITAIMFVINDPSQVYYAGLNLVALCAYAFFPQNRKTFIITTLMVYMPFGAGVAVGLLSASLGVILTCLAFISGTVVIGALVNVVNHYMEKRLAMASLELRLELNRREQVIAEKTKQGLVLERLSSQFSPQVIAALKDGSRNLEAERKRAEICAVFVDVVSSTDRIRKIDQDNFVTCIERFVEIGINTFLKYDLTIDKFYGDGILAFSNEPLRREDFIERACKAALEIKEEIATNKKWFKELWKKDFEITVGISKGYASVGFYGNTSYIKQYSAIGTCLPLSQRLCSIAEPNQILIDSDTIRSLDRSHIQVQEAGEFKLKGFGSDIFTVYELDGIVGLNLGRSYDMKCESCHKNSMFIDKQGDIYILRCRSCGHIAGDMNKSAGLKTVA